MGSCEPSKRSFLVKSMADSVALPPQCNQPADGGLGGAELETASDSARKVRAIISNGNDDFRQRCIDSEKVTKMPKERANDLAR